ncbi:MAG: hypothetical protein GKR98_04565 [Boseongicola sp.]|nr:MAG: hypothetical protein GKR98_04565 [Boseongicola sp.]
MKRRALLALSAAAFLAACGGVKDFQDQGPANMQLKLSSVDGGFMTKRSVYLDVWSGPKGPNMEYLGTREFSKLGNMVGLPTGQPLHLALAFEEAGWLGGNTGTDTIEIPMKAIRPGQMWRITVANDDLGFDWELDRIR